MLGRVQFDERVLLIALNPGPPSGIGALAARAWRNCRSYL
jgi:hypothetical protein